MLPTVLRSILTNVLGVLNRGASLSITTATNETPPVDECMSLDPRYKIDHTKCSLAPTINWHLGCYHEEYQYVIKLPMVKKVVEDRDFCKRLVDKLCGEMVNKEMREDEIKDGDKAGSNQVDLDYACSTQVCGNNYVCVMLCSHHLLAMCHIQHYSLTTAAPNASSAAPSDSACVTPDKHNVLPENISTNSNIVSTDHDMSQKTKTNYSLKNNLDKGNITETESETRDEANNKVAGDKLAAGDGAEQSSKSENFEDNVNKARKSETHSSSNGSDVDVINSTSDHSESNQKEKLKKIKESKENGGSDQKFNGRDKKGSNGDGNRRGEGTNGDGGHKNGDASKNGSPLPTVEHDPPTPPPPPKEETLHLPAAPPNKESVVVRLSNKIKVRNPRHIISAFTGFIVSLINYYEILLVLTNNDNE